MVVRDTVRDRGAGCTSSNQPGVQWKDDDQQVNQWLRNPSRWLLKRTWTAAARCPKQTSRRAKPRYAPPDAHRPVGPGTLESFTGSMLVVSIRCLCTECRRGAIFIAHAIAVVDLIWRVIVWIELFIHHHWVHLAQCQPTSNMSMMTCKLRHITSRLTA